MKIDKNAAAAGAPAGAAAATAACVYYEVFQTLSIPNGLKY